MKKIILGALILSLIAGTALASDTLSSPDPSSVLGARPLGMGGAFVALADDANSIFINPAGLAKIDKWSLTSMATQLMQKVDYKLAAGTYKIGPGTMGIGYIGTSSTAGYVYSEYGSLESSAPIAYTSNLLVLSYGVNMSKVLKNSGKMGEMALGGSIKMISKGLTEVDGAQASGVGLDLGITLTPDSWPISLGAALSNIGGGIKWTSGTKENLEQSLKLGAETTVLGKNGLYKNLPGDLVAGLELEMLADKPMVLHFGGEYKPIEYLAVRLGIDQDPFSQTKTSTCYTAGVGVTFSGFSFDYAYRMDPESSDLSNHYFSISYRPQETAKEKEAKVAEKDGTKDTVITGTEKNKDSSKDIYSLPEEYKNLNL